ncbi:MAG TPA: glycoside hydrolase family 140 protein [Armatimonadota bacterium]|nr:glycoside hydrolase family 140 protein [Armatimonadota bacterium]
MTRLKVSENRRFLVRENGKPFFYLADTAWELFHRLNREEAVRYLRNRAERKYTVIQAVALAELDGLNTPNAHGDRPLLNNDPTTPAVTPGADPKDPEQYDYWDHVDYIIREAEELGLVIALLPTWGSHVNDGPLNASNAEVYGRFLGQRYAKRSIIWVLGGDRIADGFEPVWRAMARGIAVGVSGSEDYNKLLMTFHPRGGGTSSTWFHNDAWLDFNMQQNGHGSNTDVWNRIGADYNRTPTKPVMDGEPLYEDHPIGFNAKANGYSNDYEVRKFAYWDVFAGAHGHTYGNHSVWQMHAPERQGINGPLSFWYDAINRPGAAQMQHVRALMESRPFLIRIPDQSVLASDAGSGTDRVQATRGSDGSYAFVYSASGKPFIVHMGKISGETAAAHWYDPRTGQASSIGSFPTDGTREFVPPSNGPGNDWVLVLDDARRKFPAPGTKLAE